jgi:hypothetical protein
MAPTKAEFLVEIDGLKEVIRQKDQRLQSQQDELLLLNLTIILMNQVMTKTLGVPYEPP